MNCPVCEKILDSHKAFPDEEATPELGDISICFGCSAVLEFSFGGKLIQMTPDRMMELPMETLLQMLELVDAIRRSKEEA